jgi:redox-regulated HSP33 family molecular chaperone
LPDSPAFSAECPHCHQERLLSGFAREELLQLLRAGAEIEAYCSSCDQAWPLSGEERADLARALKA